MVLATQTLLQPDPKTYEVRVDGRLVPGVSAKDIILALIARIGIGGGTGHVFEYTGEAIRGLTMEQRMTVCNMSIEGGARAGLIAPDDTTFEYLHGRTARPGRARLGRRRRALARAPDRRRRDATTRRSRSTPTRSSRWSPTARTRGWASRSPAASPRRPTRPTRASGAPSSARSSTWTSSPARRSSARRSMSSSSGAAPTAGSATCGSRRACSRTATSPTACG